MLCFLPKLTFVSWQLNFLASYYIYGTTLPSKHQQICFLWSYERITTKVNAIKPVISCALFPQQPFINSNATGQLAYLFLFWFTCLTWYHFSRQTIPRCEELSRRSHKFSWEINYFQLNPRLVFWRRNWRTFLANKKIAHVLRPRELSLIWMVWCVAK